MTPEDLLKDLRDSHLPANQMSPWSLDLNLWPYAILLALLICLTFFKIWRKTEWRRQAAKRLRSIDRLTDDQSKWKALIDLATDMAQAANRRFPLPSQVYAPLSSVDRQALSQLRGSIAREIWR